MPPSRGDFTPSVAAPEIENFRFALPDELGTLEELQRRTAMVSEYREQILAHPDAIKISLQDIVSQRARVAIQGGHIVGFSIVLPRTEGMAELDGLFVEPEYMRRGIGRALLKDAFSIVRAQGVRRIEVTSNLRAVGFYEKIGFVADEPVPTRFDLALRMHVEIAG